MPYSQSEPDRRDNRRPGHLHSSAHRADTYRMALDHTHTRHQRPLKGNERHQGGPHDDQTKHYSDYGNVRAHRPGLRRQTDSCAHTPA
jgi:hypothetical protein